MGRQSHPGDYFPGRDGQKMPNDYSAPDAFGNSLPRVKVNHRGKGNRDGIKDEQNNDG